MSSPGPNTDFLRYVGAVTREITSRAYEGRPARVLTASCAYDTTIDDLWDAITSADRIPRWFLPISGDLRLGGRYQLHGNAGGEIKVCNPPQALEITWEFGGQVSWVNVRLTKLSDGGSKLDLEHIAHVPEDMWNQFGPGAVGVGWDLILLGLRYHTGSGATVDPKVAAEWPTTPQGKAYIAESSEGWCLASIASGTPEPAAREAAGRTTAFYTGQG